MPRAHPMVRRTSSEKIDVLIARELFFLDRKSYIGGCISRTSVKFDREIVKAVEILNFFFLKPWNGAVC